MFVYAGLGRVGGQGGSGGLKGSRKVKGAEMVGLTRLRRVRQSQGE